MQLHKLGVLGTILLAAPAMLHAADGHPPAKAAAKVPMASPPSATQGVRPAARQVSEREAREWLGSYLKAWQSRDVAAITALGLIRETQQPALRKVLSGYKRLDVSVSNEAFSADGGRALLSFDRVDVDETGKELKHPRQTVLLERMPVGVVSTWRTSGVTR